MSLNYMKTNIMNFIVSYILLIIFFLFISYNFFLNDFVNLEKIQNRNNIESFLNNINKDIENLKNTTNDYSKWDDTYTFAKDKNKTYIYENFRDGSSTLKGLNLDAIIYLDKENKIIFSKYNNNYLESNQKAFENYLTTNYKNKSILNTIVNFNSKFIYLSKSEILKSDYTGDVRGYVLTVKLENNRLLSNHSIFDDIKISNVYSTKNDLNYTLSFLKNIKIKIDHDSKTIINNIMFFDSEGKYIISLVSTNKRDIVINGKKTIYIFNLVVAIILLFIFYVIYKNQYLIENQNSLLNKEVSRRTKQLDKAFRKLKVKNKELYSLANIDTLTKIKNRRSYFIESELLLEKAIKQNKNLSILLIDIDHFKTINDTFGHSVGDKILMCFCEIVSSIIDEKAVFGRIGGEEFCITFFNKNLDEVNEISEKIRINCENSEIVIDNNKIKFTVSMGLSSRKDLTDIDKILHNSDELLYQAKKSGRNKLIRSN